MSARAACSIGSPACGSPSSTTQPGVTRDRLTHLMCHDDRFFELVDTGGMGIADMDNLTRHIEEQINLAIDSADVILFVVDYARGDAAARPGRRPAAALGEVPDHPASPTRPTTSGSTRRPTSSTGSARGKPLRDQHAAKSQPGGAAEHDRRAAAAAARRTKPPRAASRR